MPRNADRAGKGEEKKKREKPIPIKSPTFSSGSVQSFTSHGCRLYLSYKDEEGKWKFKTKTLRPAKGKKLTQTEARNALALWAEELDAQAIKEKEAEEAARRAEEEAANQKPTVKEYMTEYIKGRMSIEQRTRSEYEDVLRLRIEPYLGSCRIDKLTPEMVQAWVNELSENYAPRSVRKAFVVLRAGMRLAVKRDTLDKDPTRTVETPQIETTNPNALDKAGAARVLKFISIEPSKPAYMGYSLALLMGMRQGEICGLIWRYVDLKKKELKVVQSLGHDLGMRGEGRFYIKEPKNKGSRRTLPIPDQLIEPLSVLQAHAKKAALANGMKWQDYYVIGFDDGSPMNGEMLGARWKNTAKALDLKGSEGVRPTFHDLRHTYATIAIHEGTDIKTISSYLGHKDAAMTLNIYASSDPKAKAQAEQKLADAMFEEMTKRGQDNVITFAKTGTED